jgi:hypothetical protein
MRRWEDGKDGQKSEQKSTEKAKEHPEVPDVVIGMRDERGGRGLEWLFPHLLISSSHLLLCRIAARAFAALPTKSSAPTPTKNESRVLDAAHV